MHTLLRTSLLVLLAACAATEPAGPVGPRSSPWPSLAEAEWTRVAALDGSELDLAEISEDGRAVALVFWLPECATCLEEGPSIAAASERLADELQVIGVVPGPDGDVDDAQVGAIVERLGLSYPHVRDRDGAISRDLMVRGTPTIVAFDRSGRVARRSSRVHDWDALVAELR